MSLLLNSQSEGFIHVAAVVNGNSIVKTLCQPGLCPFTRNIVKENGTSCSFIHRE